MNVYLIPIPQKPTFGLNNDNTPSKYQKSTTNNIDLFEYLEIVGKFEDKLNTDWYYRHFEEIYNSKILDVDNSGLTYAERAERIGLFDSIIEKADKQRLQMDDIQKVLLSVDSNNLTETLRNVDKSITPDTKFFKLDYLKYSLCTDNGEKVIPTREKVFNMLYPIIKNAEIDLKKFRNIIAFLETQNLDNCSIEIEDNMLKVIKLTSHKLGVNPLAMNKKSYQKISIHDINNNFNLINTRNVAINGTLILGNMMAYNAKINEINYKNNSRVTCQVNHKGLKKQIQIKEQKIEHFNDDGSLSFIEIWEPSKTKEGAYEIYQQFPDGKKIIISTAEKSNNGEYIILEKTLESSLATKTNYSSILSTSDVNGFNNSSRNYQIKDANGNYLLGRTQTIKYQDENHYTTKTKVNSDIKLRNDKWVEHYFNVKYDNETFNIKDNNGVEFSIKLSDIMDDDFSTKEFYLPILKQLPAEDLIYIKKAGIKLKCANDQASFAEWTTQTIYISSYAADNGKLFTFLHELNHLKDSNLLKNMTNATIELNEDPMFKKLYEEELKALKHNSNTTNEFLLDYFIKDTKSSSGVCEIIAEAGAINNTDISACLSFRSQTLQQYFPKTLAYLAQKISEIQFQYIYT